MVIVNKGTSTMPGEKDPTTPAENPQNPEISHGVFRTPDGHSHELPATPDGTPFVPWEIAERVQWDTPAPEQTPPTPASPTEAEVATGGARRILADRVHYDASTETHADSGADAADTKRVGLAEIFAERGEPLVVTKFSHPRDLTEHYAVREGYPELGSSVRDPDVEAYAEDKAEEARANIEFIHANRAQADGVDRYDSQPGRDYHAVDLVENPDDGRENLRSRHGVRISPAGKTHAAHKGKDHEHEYQPRLTVEWGQKVGQKRREATSAARDKVANSAVVDKIVYSRAADKIYDAKEKVKSKFKRDPNKPPRRKL